MANNFRAVGLCLAGLFAVLAAGGPSAAAIYRASGPSDLKALLPRLSPGDTVDLGSASMGDMFFRKGSIEKLNGVTLRGGVFNTIRMDDASGVTLEQGRVVMAISDVTRQFTPAVLFYRPGRVKIRNYDISSNRTSGFRLGYGIRVDQRSGGSDVTVENVKIHDLSSGVMAQGVKDFTLRRVATNMMSADSFFISNGSRVVLDSLNCGRYDGVNEKVIHPDCIQIDEVAGPTTDLLIKDLSVTQGDGDFTQWIFAGMPRGGFRHARWVITGTRGFGLTYRAISVAGVDGLTISNNNLRTPSNPKYFTMLTVDNSSDVEMRDNVACSHSRKNNTNLRETGKVTISCRHGDRR